MKHVARAGRSLSASLSAAMVLLGCTGQYYATVVIYCQGGGNGLDPVAGVDWVGMSEVPLTRGPGTGKLDAGPIIIIRY